MKTVLECEYTLFWQQWLFLQNCPEFLRLYDVFQKNFHCTHNKTSQVIMVTTKLSITKQEWLHFACGELPYRWVSCIAVCMSFTPLCFYDHRNPVLTLQMRRHLYSLVFPTVLSVSGRKFVSLSCHLVGVCSSYPQGKMPLFVSGFVCLSVWIAIWDLQETIFKDILRVFDYERIIYTLKWL